MRRLCLITALLLTALTVPVNAYPLQTKVHERTVSLDIFTENEVPYFSVSDICEYLNFTSSFKNGVLTISSYDGRTKVIDSYSSTKDLKMVESRAYVSKNTLTDIGCTITYYDTANVYDIDYVPKANELSTVTNKSEAGVSLLRRIYETDFSKFTTKTALISAFINVLNTSSTKTQHSLRKEVQRYIEYLQGENTNSNEVLKYKLALINAAEEENDINFLPFDIKWYIWHSQEQITVDNTLSNEQSIENIVNGKTIITNNNLLQVARLEATARNVKDQEDTYHKLRDYVYLQVR